MDFVFGHQHQHHGYLRLDFFRRRPWRRWRRNSARWLEDRPVDCVFVRVRTCARSVFVAINPERPPAQPRDYLRLEHFFATPLGASPRVD